MSERDVVHERVERYTFSAVEDDGELRSRVSVAVEHRGYGMWAVVWMDRCLSRTEDTFDHEPSPSARDTDWLVDHRFTLQEARKRAERLAADVKINGITARELGLRQGTPMMWPPAEAAKALIVDLDRMGL